MSRCLLIDIDSKLPNLALMKISASLKTGGNRVSLKKGAEPTLPLDCLNPEYAYVSCIFEKNKTATENLIKSLQAQGCAVISGGVGISKTSKLDLATEHIMPDYSLYGTDYSMGFSSKGCIRRCPWCVVPELEGDIRHHADIDEFLYPTHTKLMLLDSNFLASPKPEEMLESIARRKIKVCFTQGLDIRLINDHNAQLLAKCKVYSTNFGERRLYFAFDTPAIKPYVAKGIAILKRAGFRANSLMFYVLVGFNTTEAQDLERINYLISQGVLPYVMPFKKDRYTNRLAKWVNRRYYKVVPYEKFKVSYHR